VGNIGSSLLTSGVGPNIIFFTLTGVGLGVGTIAGFVEIGGSV